MATDQDSTTYKKQFNKRNQTKNMSKSEKRRGDGEELVAMRIACRFGVDVLASAERKRRRADIGVYTNLFHVKSRYIEKYKELQLNLCILCMW